MDTGQKTESLSRLVHDIDKGAVALPEFQRDFVWEIEKTLDLFDSFVRDIFVGALIYGVPSFEITVRELDPRPRTGKGSRRKLTLTSFSKFEIEKRVKTSGFRLLLDGQQRATSIYRALKGIDEIYFVIADEEDLPSGIRAAAIAKRGLEDVLSEFRASSVSGKINIKMSDVFRVLNGESPRERDQIELFLKSSPLPHITKENASESPEFSTYLTQLKNMENLLRQEKLVAYYLLDTDEEKFALFFERSNSKGIQLNFIDILAAKLYGGFNLREQIEIFSTEHPDLELNREVIVRAISYEVSNGRETGRSYILASLTHTHFNQHWPGFTESYTKAFEYLIATRLLISPDWIPYENMLIPIMTFLRQVPGRDFGQITAMQARVLRTWYWLAIMSRRYSSAAQTGVLEDAQALEKAGRGDFSLIRPLLLRMYPVIHEFDDLYTVNRKQDALYRGILNFIHFAGSGLRNLENGNPVTSSSSLEDHHIFPKDYLRRNPSLVDVSMDAQVLIDCVANRTLIPKLTNIRVSNKPPSVYLSSLEAKNAGLSSALDSHLIPTDLATGAYDDLYMLFLEDRAKLIIDGINSLVMREREALTSGEGGMLPIDEPGDGRLIATKKRVTSPHTESESAHLPQSEFRVPLLEVMHELGGRARTAQIRTAIKEKLTPLLRGGDYRQLTNTDQRWWNATQWNRYFLVKEGIFRADSEHGVWELTDEGKKYVSGLVANKRSSEG